MVCGYEAAGRRSQRNGFTPATVRTEASKHFRGMQPEWGRFSSWLDQQEAHRDL